MTFEKWHFSACAINGYAMIFFSAHGQKPNLKIQILWHFGSLKYKWNSLYLRSKSSLYSSTPCMRTAKWWLNEFDNYFIVYSLASISRYGIGPPRKSWTLFFKGIFCLPHKSRESLMIHSVRPTIRRIGIGQFSA